MKLTRRWTTVSVALLCGIAATFVGCGEESNSAANSAAEPACAQPAAAPIQVSIDPSGGGRTFDGVGAISSGGNDRYLLEYPEAQQKEILDYLFKPGVGASLQILKAEIGGDANSTDGADASHMHARDAVDCNASYQFWVMEQAKARNPNIVLAGLAWGAPGWLGDGQYWSADTIDYLMKWIDCANAHGLRIDYIGGRNEMGFDRAWYLALRAAVNQRHPETKIVGADTIAPSLWNFVNAMDGDPELTAAVDKVGVHYPCKEEGCPSPANAQNIGKPLWASENSGGDDGQMARTLNRQYLDGKFTCFMNWSLIVACSDQLAYGGGGGFVEARWPWSGHYRVSRNAWTAAHTTQFTEIGWHYLDNGSGYFTSSYQDGTYVTLAAPDLSTYTVVVETSEAAVDQTVALTFAPQLASAPLHVWTTDMQSPDEGDWFVNTCTARPEGGVVRLTLAPHHLYTLTTMSGGGKMHTTIPTQTPFPLPYSNDFEHDTIGREGRHLANQHGAFAVEPCAGGREGLCVQQMAPQWPNPWLARNSQPFTVIGDASLSDYTVTVDFLLDQAGDVTLFGRYGNQAYTFLTYHTGYQFQINSAGTWSITRSTNSSVQALGQGTSPAIEPNTWHTAAFTLQGSTLTGKLDGVTLGSVGDSAHGTGLAGIGFGDASSPVAPTSGWSANQFDNLSITVP